MKQVWMIAGICIITIHASGQVNNNNYQDNYQQHMNQALPKTDTGGTRIIDQNRSMHYNTDPNTRQPPYHPDVNPPDTLRYRKP